MKYVLDTNVIKRFGGANPNPNVARWRQTLNDNEIFITSLSIQEIRKGIELLRRNSDPKKSQSAANLQLALDKLIAEFQDRILPIDTPVALEWGRRLAKHGTKDANDLAIVSIVAAHQPATAVTQNLADFRHRGVEVINPYDDPPGQYNDPET
jgi:predicted nucleic acid-binding protein